MKRKVYHVGINFNDAYYLVTIPGGSKSTAKMQAINEVVKKYGIDPKYIPYFEVRIKEETL